MLCIPGSLSSGGLYFCLAPRLYHAECILDHKGGYEALHPTFVAKAMPYLNNDPRMLQLRETSLCSVELYDPDPQRAAQKANQLGESIRDEMNRLVGEPPATEGFSSHVVKIWQRAKPEKVPARPDAANVLIWAIAAGLCFALPGTLLLLVRYFLIRSRELKAEDLAR